MQQDVRAWMDRYFQVINTQPKTREVLERYVQDESLLEHILASERTFPDYRMRVEDLLVDNDRVAVRFTLSGSQLGDFYGLPPSGRAVEVPGIIIYRLEADRIAAHWLHLDTAALQQQLSVPLAPSTAEEHQAPLASS